MAGVPTDEKVAASIVASANYNGMLDESYLAHVERAVQFFAEKKVSVRVHDTELVGVAEHGPLVMVTHRMGLGDDEFVALAEMGHVFVVGVYIPHDGNVTTTIYGMEGVATFDNAEEMFPSS